VSEASDEIEEGGWPKRRLRTALLCSLAVNLLCVGLIGGAILAGPPHRPHTEFGMKGFARTLPAERGAILHDAITPQRPQIRALRDAARAARLDATKALVAETYDKEQVRAALAKIDDSETKLRALVSNIFIETAEKLTLQERQQLAEWWKKRQPKMFWRHGKRPGEDEPK
jgi:uncharacterized membrane protein